MTPEQIKDLKRLIILVADYYGRELKPEVVRLMAHDLQDLAWEDVRRAFDDYRRMSKVHTFPMPATIREIIKRDLSDDQIAVEVAARIVTAVSKFGYTNPDEARAYVGEIGWLVIEKQGGWRDLCENLMANKVGVFQAQAREIAKVQLALARSKTGDKPPSLPQNRSRALDAAILSLPSHEGNQAAKNGLSSVGEVLKGGLVDRK